MEAIMYKRNLLRILMTVSLLGLNLFTTTALQSKAGITTPKFQEQAMTKMKDATTQESPFVCNVAGLNAEQRQRYIALIKKLKIRKQEVRELADGYAFRFSSDTATIQDLAEFIIYERLCCPFFDFDLVVEREGGPAWLRLRGREGVKEFIRIEFGIK
jgi:hypothetical protein